MENQLLEGLCDLAQEPGTVNNNFGPALGDTTTKPVFIRFPGRTDLYMDTNGAFLGSGAGTGWPMTNGYGPLNGWRPFDGHGQPVPEDVSTYLCRAVAWTEWITGCDGFRLDAVKHVPVNFFGNETGQTDDPKFARLHRRHPGDVRLRARLRQQRDRQRLHRNRRLPEQSVSIPKRRATMP